MPLIFAYSRTLELRYKYSQPHSQGYSLSQALCYSKTSEIWYVHDQRKFFLVQIYSSSYLRIQSKWILFLLIYSRLFAAVIYLSTFFPQWNSPIIGKKPNSQDKITLNPLLLLKLSICYEIGTSGFLKMHYFQVKNNRRARIDNNFIPDNIA